MIQHSSYYLYCINNDFNNIDITNIIMTQTYTRIHIRVYPHLG